MKAKTILKNKIVKNKKTTGALLLAVALVIGVWLVLPSQSGGGGFFSDDCVWVTEGIYICPHGYLATSSETTLRAISWNKNGIEQEGVECVLEKLGTTWIDETQYTTKHCTGDRCIYAEFSDPRVTGATVADTYQGYCKCDGDIDYFQGHLYLGYIIYTYTELDCSSSTTTTQPSGSVCVDSDGGLNYDVKGSVSIYGLESGEDSCSGVYVLEKYCDGSSVSTKTYKCPISCVNGHCSDTPVVTTTKATTSTTKAPAQTTVPPATTSTTLDGGLGGGGDDLTDKIILVVAGFLGIGAVLAVIGGIVLKMKGRI